MKYWNIRGNPSFIHVGVARATNSRNNQHSDAG